jgi:RNA methyltransferase, TrmH family
MLYGLKILSKFANKKYRDEYGAFLVEGEKSVEEALEANAEVLQLVVTEHFLQRHPEFAKLSKVRNFFDRNWVLRLSESDFRQLSDTVTPAGVMAVVKKPEVHLEMLKGGKILAILEDIRDPGNLGTMIRTADWFGVDGLILVGGADPYQSKVVRSSMGSLFHVPLFLSQDITEEIKELKAIGFTLISTRPELSAGAKFTTISAEKSCFIFGNESRGTSADLDELADQTYSIPKIGHAESLNVAVSFGIAMYSIAKETAR